MDAKFSAITPQAFNVEVFLDEWGKAIEETIEEADRLFKQTYATFEYPPEFDKKVERDSDKIVGSTTTDNEVYGYLTRGTRVRYATMTPDFIAKTFPRRLAGGAGRGGVAFIDRRRPRPGIEAREWEEVVKEQVEPVLNRKLGGATNEAAKKSGHGF